MALNLGYPSNNLDFFESESGNGGGTDTPTTDHIFESVAARDAHFVANPDELASGLPIFVEDSGETYIERWGSGSQASYDPVTDASHWARGGAIGLDGAQIAALLDGQLTQSGWQSDDANDSIMYASDNRQYFRANSATYVQLGGVLTVNNSKELLVDARLNAWKTTAGNVTMFLAFQDIDDGSDYGSHTIAATNDVTAITNALPFSNLPDPATKAQLNIRILVANSPSGGNNSIRYGSLKINKRKR